MQGRNKIGNNFSLGQNSIIECTGVIRELGESLVIGDNVGISANAFISVRGKVKIGDSTIFGPGVSLFSENHILKIKAYLYICKVQHAKVLKLEKTAG